MKRFLLAVLLLSSVLAYDASQNDLLLTYDKTVFVSINAPTECAIVQNREVKGFCSGTCSVKIKDADFSVYCSGYESTLVDITKGSPYTVTPIPVIPGIRHYVSGQVKNQWGIPLKALVTTFFGDYEASTVSNENGYFSLNVPDGSYLQAMAPAHRDYTGGSSITSPKNVGTLTVQTLNKGEFETYGIADYCQETGCSCSDYGFSDCYFDGTASCIESGECCPSENNCIDMGGDFKRVEARLSVDPTELALVPGESDSADIIIRSNLNGTYTLVAQSLNFPVTLSSSQYSVAAGIPSTGEITVSYPTETLLKSDSVNLQLKYGSTILAEKTLIVGILTPDADVETKTCSWVNEEKTKQDCIFKVSNVGSFQIENVAIKLPSSTEIVNLTIAPNDYVYYLAKGISEFSSITFSYDTRGNTWTEQKVLSVTQKEDKEKGFDFMNVLGEVFKSIFG